ncbi:MAG TPA: CinA family protein [Candidatus Binataceae bacterium]|nr:CinA family protein [Candidatus Binataceae bacterium]
MRELIPVAEKIGAMLQSRGESVAVAESTTGGLISAAILSVAGASAYFIGGGVVYTLKGRRAFGIPDEDFKGFRSVTEQYSMALARRARERFGATWAIAEIGASGPTGNRYGDAAGHSCVAVAGPVERSLTIETGSPDRVANMYLFSAKALDLLVQSLAAAPSAGA